MTEKRPENIIILPELVEKRVLNQSLHNRIDDLCVKSNFSYLEPRKVDCSIKNLEGEYFDIKLIENSESPEFNDIINVLKETFGSNKIDSDDVLKAALNGKNINGMPRNKYRAISVYDDKKELSVALISSLLDFKNSENNSIKEMVYFVEYIATNPNLKKGGLAREAYISSLIDAKNITKENNNKISFSAGECTESSELFWNNMGEKRIYIKHNNKYSELPYISPALNFDKDTGNISLNNSGLPLHLMIDSFDDKKINKDDVRNIYESIITAEMWSRNFFTSDIAYENYFKYIQNLKDKFIASLELQGEVVLLTAEERENLKYKLQ